MYLINGDVLNAASEGSAESHKKAPLPSDFLLDFLKSGSTALALMFPSPLWQKDKRQKFTILTGQQQMEQIVIFSPLIKDFI